MKRKLDKKAKAKPSFKQRLSAWRQGRLQRMAEHSLGRFLLGEQKSRELLGEGAYGEIRAMDKELRRRQIEFWAQRIGQNPISRFSSRLRLSLLSCEARQYAALFFPFALALLIRFLFLPLLVETLPLSVGYSVLGGALFFLSIFLRPVSSSAASVLGRIPLVSFLLFDFLAARRPEEPKQAMNAAPPLFLFGVLAAAASAFFSPLLVMAIGGALLFSALAFASPEFPLSVTVLLLPFSALLPFSNQLLSSLFLLTALSYFRKLLIGKRLFRFQPLDLSVFLFALLYVFGSLNTMENEDLLFYFFLLTAGYFLTVNLLSERRLLANLLRVLLCSVTLLSILGFARALFLILPESFLEGPVKEEFLAFVLRLLPSEALFASFLLLMIPSALALCNDGEKIGVPPLLIAVFLMCVLVFTDVKSAWAAVLFSVLLFLLLTSKVKARFLTASVLILPNLLPLLPEAATSRLSSALSSVSPALGDALADRFTVWHASLSLFTSRPFNGIGLSEEVFASMIAPYLPSGMTAYHSGNLLLQIGIETGTLSLFAFLLLLAFLFREIFKKDFIRGESPCHNLAIGAFTGLCGLLFFGTFTDPLYSFRVFFLFFLMMGLFTAALRNARQEEQAERALQQESTFGQMGIRIRKL